MGKKFCYLEGKATPPTTTSRIGGKDHRGRGDKDQVSGEEDDEDDGRDRQTMFPQQSTTVKRVMSQLAHGYLKLVHRIEDKEPDRAVGGTVWEGRQPPQSPQSAQSPQPPTEDEISTSSEEYPPRGSVGFVDLFRRSLHFEKMGLPVTALELYSMDYLERRKGETRMQGGFLNDQHSLENHDTIALRRKSSYKVTAGGSTRLESSFHSRRLNWKGQTPPKEKQFLKIQNLETENKRDSLLKHKLENQGSIFDNKEVEMADQKRGPYRNNNRKDGMRQRSYSRSSSPEPVLSWNYAKTNIHEEDKKEEVVAPRYQSRRSTVPVLKALVQPRSISYSEEALAERWERESASSCSCEEEPKSKRSFVTVMQKTTPRRSCLKKPKLDHNAGSRSSSPGRSLAGYEADSELQTSRHSSEGQYQDLESDTLTAVWKMPIYYCKKPPSHGLYRLGSALKYQPIDRLDAGCLTTPLFEEDDDLDRAKYFAGEFAKLTLDEQRQDLAFRLGQVRLLQDMSDEEYRQRIVAQGFVVRPIVRLGEKHPCPFGRRRCPMVRNEHLLIHYLEYHGDTSVQVTETFEENRLLVVFEPKNLDLGRNTCISVLVYGGVRGRHCTLPIRRFMPTPNKDLPESFANLEGCLPLFVMICRNRPESRRRVRFRDIAGGCHGDTDSDYPVTPDDESDVLTLWMMSMDLPQPIHCMITVFNRRLDASVSSILKVRGLRKSHQCRAVMQSRHYHMRLGGKDLKILTNNNTESLYLEVTIKEYAGLFPLQGHTCRAHSHHRN
ncbi:uncharacterized protein [Drosophila bipectinata]|uniref:uncharacterized protein n=1 Tax=Drosophila bipectinata TaxID=42026 RepID=UPI001C898AEC|nr:uncharacterized protein LOC108133635 [Drosophila bipectinata]